MSIWIMPKNYSLKFVVSFEIYFDWANYNFRAHPLRHLLEWRFPYCDISVTSAICEKTVKF